MSDKPQFDPNKLIIVDFKTIKAHMETPEEFLMEKVEGHNLENELQLAFNLDDKLAKADYTIQVKTESKGGNDIEASGSFHFVFIYKVENLDELAELDNKNNLDVHPVLGNALSSITYSTIRGILLAKLQGSALEGFILPVINPNRLLNN
jgi:hypothetical protein